jgi:hypothetical protein
MSNKNKKIIIGLVVLLIVAAVAAGVGIWKRYQDDNQLKQLGEIRQAASIDDYIESDPGLMHKKSAEELELAPKEITAPVPAQIPLQKMTMAPIGMEGGDAIYSIIGELPNNNFFKLGPDKFNKVFSVGSPGEALKYVNFLMVTAGQSSYDRARTTVWSQTDYDKLGCQAGSNESSRSLPTDRPVSQTKGSGDGFEVTWIYFTPAVPAGYHKMLLQVGKDGEYSVLDDPDDPFWPCGGGFVF